MSSYINNQHIRVGPAGWHYKDWYGNVYPSNPQKGFGELEYIATFFDTAEINSTYYRPATAQMALAWVRKVKHNPRFMFTAKLWQRFTHQRTEFTHQEIHQVQAGMDPLMESELLGAVLIQFPWSFKCDNSGKRWLAKILKTFEMYPLVVEVRHSSWDQLPFYQYLNDQNVGIAAIDQPVIGDSIPLKPMQTGSIGYVRMHGRNYDSWFPKKNSPEQIKQNPSARYDYLYSPKEMSEISKTVKVVSEKSKETYVIQNNHPNGQAIANAAQLLAELGEDQIKLPESLLNAFPNLKKYSMPF